MAQPLTKRVSSHRSPTAVKPVMLPDPFPNLLMNKVKSVLPWIHHSHSSLRGRSILLTPDFRVSYHSQIFNSYSQTLFLSLSVVSNFISSKIRKRCDFIGLFSECTPCFMLVNKHGSNSYHLLNACYDA